MQGIEEMKILIGNCGQYTNYKVDDIFINLKFKFRQLSSNICIVCAEYNLTYGETNSKYWVINFIIPFKKVLIREFLEDFGRNVIITDEWYRACGLYHMMTFQNRLDQRELDEVHSRLDQHFRERINKEGIIILENEDFIISKIDSCSKIDLPDIIRFRPEILTYEVY